MYRYWTKEEIEILSAEYGKTRCVDIAKRLDRSVRSVEKKAAKLGLKSKVPGGKMYQNPHNKGKEWNPMEKHHAWRKVGDIWPAAGTLWTKPSRESGPVLFRRWLMEKYGWDLTDKVVIHKDGDTMNCQFENLDVTTKAKLVRRNYDNCKDPHMRSLRMRMARTGETIVDLVLKCEI